MIELKNVNKTFGYEKQHALRDISFKINDGENFAVLGLDGSGKSSLLSILAGCLPPSSGRVLIDGKDLYQRPQECIRRIGYMPSKLYMYPEMTVKEYISYMFEIKGAKPSRVRIDEVLTSCMLDNADALISSLDRTDSIKLNLAQAISGDISILILDEPTSGLKREEAAKMRSMLKPLRDRYTFIMSSKILREATELCDDILIMNRGKISLNSSITELASGSASLAVLRLRIYADEERTDEFIAALSEYCDIQRLSSVELGSSDMLLSFPSDTDIRPVIWQETVKRNIPILEMTRKDLSLEEIFLQMTGDSQP